MKRFLTISLFLLIVINSVGQEYPLQEIDIQQFVEEIFAFQDEDASYDELYEALLLHYSDPLNLNIADREDLKSLFVLSDYQINNFLDYREKYGALLSIYELQAIPGFDKTTIYRFLPFVTIRDDGLSADNRPLLKRIFSERNNYLLLRYERTLEEKKGYTTPVIHAGETPPSRYVGGSGKHYARFRVSHTRDFSIGFTAEKDAGEAYTWDAETNRYGADFYSWHFQLQNKGKLKNLIVGDYQIQYGQSLLLGAGFNVGKGGETITTVRRSNSGIRPYTSVIETGFFRGAASTYQAGKNIEVTGFYSMLNQDAIVRADSAESIEDFITSIQSSGFHRTPNEIDAKGDILEQTYGGVIHYQNKQKDLQIGLTGVVNDFEVPLIRNNTLYNTFEFSGTNNYNVGLFYNYNWQNVSLFGEAARSKNGGIGAVGGAIVSLTPKLETSIVLRNYDKDFHSFYGQSFGESSTRNINERGLYWGLKYRPTRKYEFSAYFDQFTFPWLRFGINAPSSGYEYLLRANYKPSRGTLLYAQYRQQSKMDDPSGQEEPIHFPLNGIKRNYLINLDLKVNDNLGLKSRVQFSNYDFNNQRTKGYAIMQDLYATFWNFKLSTRFALFDTEDFENRQYAYERDVLYAFSIPAYFGVGTRQYILLQYGVTRKIDLYARIARTHYRDRDTISSGLEAIDGNKKTDVKFQVRVKF
ncbi:MAG: helix-hairpin-helix domain-containing protein [Fulvivirga sp.]